MNVQEVKNLPIPRILHKALPELLIKRAMLESEAGDIETLVLGHSQGGHAFNPKYFPHSFNACSRSQDIKMSYQLYEKFGEALPRLKRVILFYSFIAPGFLAADIESERAIAAAFNEVYKLGYHFESDYLDLLANDFDGLFDNISIDHNEAGFYGEHGYVQNVDATYFENTYWQRRRLPQLYGFNLKDDAVMYLDKIISLAQKRGHEIYFVVAPNRSDTIAGILGDSNHLHRYLIDALSQFKMDRDAVYMDFYGSPEFSDAEFGDFTHLFPGSGAAELLTKRVREMVERNEGEL